MDDKESEHHTVLKADFSQVLRISPNLRTPHSSFSFLVLFSSQFEHEVNRIVVARAFPTLRRIDEASDSDNDEAGPQTISYQERQRARVAVAAQARAHLPSHKNTKFVVVPSTTDASDSKKSTESTIPVQDHAMETVDTSGPSASAPAAPALPPPISAAPPPAPIGVGDKARKMLNLIPSTPMIGSQIVTLLAQNANASVDVVNDEFRRAVRYFG
jgi:hypothetical protein